MKSCLKIHPFRERTQQPANVPVQGRARKGVEFFEGLHADRISVEFRMLSDKLPDFSFDSIPFDRVEHFTAQMKKQLRPVSRLLLTGKRKVLKNNFPGQSAAIQARLLFVVGDRQPLAAFGTAAFQDLAAVLCFHACAETVFGVAFLVGGPAKCLLAHLDLAPG